MKRGAVKKSESKLINIWVPLPLLPILDTAVRDADSDRSKYIRIAIREKIAREKEAA